MRGIRIPTQAEIAAIDPAELHAGLMDLGIGERLLGIRFRDEAGEKLWAAFCERWKLRRPDKRTHRGGTRKNLLANVHVAAAEIGVTHPTIYLALRTGRVTMRVLEGMLEMRFDEWSAMALGDQITVFEERLKWWKAHRAPVLGHGDRGPYERMLRARWAKRRKEKAA
jgi:hypothetical protein